MRLTDVWLNNFNGYPIIVKSYSRNVQAITSRRKQCDFVAIIGYKRADVIQVLTENKFKSPIAKKSGGYVALIAKGDYYGT